MTLEEAIKTALMYEIKIRDAYVAAVKATQDEAGKKIFQQLADDEQCHVDYLEHKLKQWQETGSITVEKLESSIPAREVIQKEAEKIRSKVTGEFRGLKEQMLSKALQLELETSSFYRKMVDQMSAEGKEMFARFLEIEDNHVEAVQFELDHVGQMGFWFGFEEFDMEAGEA